MSGMSGRCTRKQFNSPNSLTLEDAECLFTKNKLIDGVPTVEQPHLIIKFGPTGSGKGSDAVRKEIEILGHSIDDYISLEIDLLVEAISSYRNKTVNLKKKKNAEANTYPNANFFGNLYKAYATTRTAAIESYLINIFKAAVEKRKNIIYETTGSNFSRFQQLIDDAYTARYKIVVIYPIVSKEDLTHRVAERAMRRYNAEGLYRHSNPFSLEKGISDARSVLHTNILPYLYDKRIHKLVMFWND